MAGENITTYGDINPRTAAKAAAKFIKLANLQLVTQRFAQPYELGKNQTKSIKWRRYNRFPVPTGALSEGVTPVAQKPTCVDVAATLQQEGASTEITDVIQDTHEDPVLIKMVDLSKDQGAETIETRNIGVLKGGTQVMYAGGVTSRAAVIKVVTKGMLRKAERAMDRNKAGKITSIMKSAALYGVEPIAPAYIGLGHTDLRADLEEIRGWVPVEKYAATEQALPFEAGKIGSIRFLLTSMFTPWIDAGGDVGTTGMISTSGTKVDVYPLIILGQDAWGTVALAGEEAVKLYVLNPDKPDKSDPMAQRGFVSWKTYWAGVILNDANMLRIETAATNNPE